MSPTTKKHKVDANKKEDKAGEGAPKGPKIAWTESEKAEISRYLLSKNPPTLTKEDLEALVRLLPGRSESGIATVWQRTMRPEVIKTGNMAKLSK